MIGHPASVAARKTASATFSGAVLLEGELELCVTGRAPERLGSGDFVLIPAAAEFTISSLTPPPGGRTMQPQELSPGVFHLGEAHAPDTRMLIGYCSFDTDDADLLVSLLGYSSSSTFSVAFTRQVGKTPAAFARLK